MTMCHDITHCSGADCAKKEQCFRYQAHLELREKKLEGLYSYFSEPTKMKCYE